MSDLFHDPHHEAQVKRLAKISTQHQWEDAMLVELRRILPDGVVTGSVYAFNGIEYNLSTDSWANTTTGESGAGLSSLTDAVGRLVVPINLTDLGNARRIAAEHRENIRFAGGRWHIWDGQRWRPDELGSIERKAKTTLLHIYDEAIRADDPTTREALIKHALRSEGAGRIAAAIKLAESEPGIPIPRASLNGDPWLLNTPDWTVDLRTGQARRPRRDDYITCITSVPYDPAATAPTWDAFLKRILPEDIIVFLQRAVGYALTGSTREQVLFFLYGSGANGKTTFLEAIRHAIGDYAVQVPMSAIASKPNHNENNPSIAALHGARFAVSVESDENMRIAEGLIKQLTSEEKITACRKYENPFEFTPTHKLFIGTNHKPTIRGTDYGIWRRIRLVPFTETIQPADRDPNMLDKLRLEAPGILSWAVQGCLEWQKHGLGLPGAVSDATEAYRSEMDVIGAFIEQECVLSEHAKILGGNLYKRYSQWCDETGEYQINNREFGKKMVERGIEIKRSNGSWYVGINLNSTEISF